MVDEEFLRYGGRQKHIYYLSKELLKRGHKVTILSPKGNFRWFSMRVKTFKEWGFPLIKSKVIPEYSSSIEGYDIVHSHDTLFSAFLVKHAKHFFITTHGLRCSLNCGYGLIGQLFHKMITEQNLKAANDKGCIFCVSDYDLAICKKLGFNNSHYVPNGVDIGAIQAADGRSFRKRHELTGNMVLEVSRLSSVKGQLRFLRDCAEKIKREVDTCFVFVGAKEEERYIPQLKDEAQKRKLDVRILPDLPDEEVYQAYKACDVFVLPSEFEGQPISILEAFAAKKPVVTTDVGGIRKSAGSFARVVHFWEPDKFAEEVAHLLKNKNLRQKVGKKAFKHAKQFSWDKVAEFVERKYLEALD